MCWLVRCTARRTAPCRPMRTRVLAARRSLDLLLSSMYLAPLLEELSGNLLSARTIAPLLHFSHSHLLLLRFLERHRLAHIAHALALVGLRRLVGADLGGHLAHLLAVDTLDHDLGL